MKTSLCDDLGLRVFDLRNDMCDGNFEKQIKEMIDESLLNGYVIFLITDNFLKSPWCNKELEYVLQKKSLGKLSSYGMSKQNVPK